jgi:dethiobiotin synthetase
MSKGYFITGTDTEIGKTLVTGLLGRYFQLQGMSVGAFKPIASGGEEKDGVLCSEDALFLKSFLKLAEPLELINPLCLQKPLAPKVAAEQDNHQIKLEKYINAFHAYQEKVDVLLVEGVGGVMVPIKKDYLVADMIKEVGLPVIIVTRPNLGTINHTILTTSYLQQEDIPIAGIVINYSKQQEKGLAEKTNPQEIKRLSGVPIIGEVPYIENLESLTDAALRSFFSEFS